MKIKFNDECPCGKYNIKVTVESEDEEELFCPICTASLTEEDKITEIDDEDE